MIGDDEWLRISRIATYWPLVQQAHSGPAEERPGARKELLDRYGPAVRIYLQKVLRKPEAVDDVFQEFALRVLRGDLHRADPGRGRFRHYVKTTLYHLIADFRRREHAQPRPLGEHDIATVADPAEFTELDQALLADLREGFLVRAWKVLETAEREGGSPHHTVLRLKSEFPDLKSPDMATKLGERLGKKVTAGNCRQMLDRARHRLAQAVVELVVAARSPRTRIDLSDALSDLGLVEFCLHAVAEWQPPESPHHA